MFKLINNKKLITLYLVLAALFCVVCAYSRQGFSLIGAALFLNLGLLAYTSLVDLKDKEIDWRILMVGLVSGIIISLLANDFSLYLIAGPISCAMIPFILVSISREKWMGWGDVVIALWVGAIAGYPFSLVAIFLAFFLGSLSGIILLKGRHDQSSTFAFGPYLLLGCLYSIILTDKIILWVGGL